MTSDWRSWDAQQRAVLSALAVDAGRPVMLQTLIDRVWDQAPPVGTRSALYTSLVIENLEPDRDKHGATCGPARTAGGYVVEIDPDLVDTCFGSAD